MKTYIALLIAGMTFVGAADAAFVKVCGKPFCTKNGCFPVCAYKKVPDISNDKKDNSRKPVSRLR